MKCGSYIFIVGFFLLSCEGGRDNNEQEDTTDQKESIRSQQQSRLMSDTTDWLTYSDSTYFFNLKYPEEWKINKQEEPFKIVNIYNPAHLEKDDLPLHIHSNAQVSHITFFPNGYGTEYPEGKSKTLSEWNESLLTDFEVDEKNSRVFLTENNDAWAYLLHFNGSPPGWSSDGFIFIQINTTNLSFQCFDKESGKKVAMEQCDPLTGDTVKRIGNVSEVDQQIVRKMLSSLFFFDERNTRKPLEDLISIDQPDAGDTISSPVRIEGEARGYWYFEGDFPVEVINSKGKVVGNGIAVAKGNWMTEEFVSFEVEINFKSMKNEKGYIVFKRSNASGLPQHDRTHRIPVIFN